MFDACIDQPLSENEPELRICVSVPSNTDANVVSFDSVKLRQGDLFFSIVDVGAPIDENGDTKLKWSGANTCSMETLIGSVFFGRNRPSSIVVEGNVFVEEPHSFTQHKWIKSKIPFGVTVPLLLNQNSAVPTSAPTNLDIPDERIGLIWFGGGTAACVLILFVLVFCGWLYKKYRTSKHDTRIIEEEFFGTSF